MLALDPNNLAGGVPGDGSSISLVKARKGELVVEDICAHVTYTETWNSAYLTGKTPRREAYRWWYLHLGHMDKHMWQRVSQWQY